MKLEEKRMDLLTLNEINDASMKLVTLNRQLWILVDRVQKSLAVDRVRLLEFRGRKDSGSGARALARLK